MTKLFEQFKKDTGDNWSYLNGWDFAPEEIVTQKYIEWLEEKLTSDNSDYAKCPQCGSKGTFLYRTCGACDWNDYVG